VEKDGNIASSVMLESLNVRFKIWLQKQYPWFGDVYFEINEECPIF